MITGRHSILLMTIAVLAISACNQQKLEKSEDGYKGVAWGANRKDAAAAWQTSLSGGGKGGRSPTDSWILDKVFYRIWKVPMKSFGSMTEHIHDTVPDKFSVFKTPSDDKAVFFNGGLYAYYFEMKAAANYAAYKNKLQDKYGIPQVLSVSFDNPANVGEFFDYTINIWRSGRTVIWLLRQRLRVGMQFSSLYTFYFDALVDKTIRDSIRASYAAMKRAEQKQENSREKEDADKLQ